MNFAALLLLVKATIAAVKKYITDTAPPDTGSVGSPAAVVSAAHAALVADVYIAEKELAEIEAGCAAPAGAQAVFGDRIKKLIALLLKLLGGLA